MVGWKEKTCEDIAIGRGIMIHTSEHATTTMATSATTITTRDTLNNLMDFVLLSRLVCRLYNEMRYNMVDKSRAGK